MIQSDPSFLCAPLYHLHLYYGQFCWAQRYQLLLSYIIPTSVIRTTRYWGYLIRLIPFIFVLGGGVGVHFN